MRYDAGEVITAMVTPFNEKREVDYEKVEQLAYQLINTGSDAVLVTSCHLIQYSVKNRC